MIKIENLPTLLKCLEFTENKGVYKKTYGKGASIEVDTNKKKITYAPLDSSFGEGEFPSKNKPAKGFVIHRDTTLNFSANENFVCLVCVHLLLKKGYEPRHIIIEPSFRVAHGVKPAYGDILVFDKEYNPLVLIENKTYGAEFSKEWNLMQKNGGQLFGYLGEIVKTMKLCQNLVLFAADFDEKRIVPKSYIVTIKDNEKRIAELDNPTTFANAQGKYFEVWSQTYGNAIETKGLFEDDVEVYTIGKPKYTINDLNPLSHAEIKPIYNEFATILRNHAITDFEHSFYILIDLFLCKITDECNNPNDLQFYYKGITRDTPKEYCTRLLNLYQLGKKELFGVDVVNKNESDISQIFEDKNRTKNGLYEGIRELFEEIKFYNIKKFNFIDVENKEDFELNFSILIEIAALIQDVNLSSSETNHFFGDLFEGLLSKNVHQTEGQFFTPLPIVNFIIKSLPQFANTGNVKVLDYACGAGHFLTEFVKSYPKAQAYGIEKSQPLSQVAKIATIINGAKEKSHIVFKDALSQMNTNEVRFQGFDKESFDCIIANPPYSVKGFLNTLTERDREQFNLINYVDSKAYETNNSIECFFIEQTIHFLKPNGLIGIVLPSSILSNGNLYTRTRELLFANFNILAIVNLNSRTFGSTGTNTIVLFAQRVKKNAEGLVDTFAGKKEYTSYTNHTSIEQYFRKQGYDRDEFFALIQDEVLGETLEEHDIIKEYKNKFKAKPINKAVQKEWFAEWEMYPTGCKDNTKQYKDCFAKFIASDEYKQCEAEELRRQFVEFVKRTECDKLKTYVQIADNKVVILQSPPEKVGSKSNKQQIVKFLGYDWSNRKGDEGIKYVTNKAVSDLREETDDKDDEILKAINSIRFIETPLYDPNDDWNNHKLAYAIRKHIYQQCRKFSFGKSEIKVECQNVDFDGEMSELLSYAELSDMIDFGRAEFDKSIKLIAEKKIEIESKYQLEKLGEIADVKKGQTITQSQTKEGNIKVVAGGVDYAYLHNESNRPANTITVSASGANAGFVNLWREPIFASDCTTIRGKDDLHTLYLYNFLLSIQNQIYHLQKGAGQPHVYPDDLKLIKVPTIDRPLQEIIVTKCEKVDEEYNNSRMSIEEYKKKIVEVFERLDVISKVEGVIYKLTDNDAFDIMIGRRVLNKDMKPDYTIPVYSANVFEPFGMVDKLLITDFDRDSVVWGIDGDWMVNVIPSNKPFYPTDHCGVLRIKTDEILPQYMAHLLEEEGRKVGFKRSYRASIDRIEGLSFKVAPVDEQKKAILEVEKYEEIINNAKAKMASCAERKRAIVEKYLR